MGTAGAASAVVVFATGGGAVAIGGAGAERASGGALAVSRVSEPEIADMLEVEQTVRPFAEEAEIDPLELCHDSSRDESFDAPFFLGVGCGICVARWRASGDSFGIPVGNGMRGAGGFAAEFGGDSIEGLPTGLASVDVALEPFRALAETPRAAATPARPGMRSALSKFNFPKCIKSRFSAIAGHSGS